MELVDAWRLLGPNLQTRGPAALAEAKLLPGEDAAEAFALWREEARRMAAAAMVEFDQPAARAFKGGAVFTFEAPVDVLLAATDVAEWAVGSAAARLAGCAPLDLEPRRAEIAALAAEKRNAPLLALLAEAKRRGAPVLLDDEKVTLGLGRRARSWPLLAPPRPEDAPWGEIGAIPLGLVTGTNGKTTSTRLASWILRAEGRVVATTTTDGVAVNDTLLEAGDYTGPAGARMALRRPEIDAAVLETARGGILRRGLAVDAATAALLTNVSDDHLGLYGVDDVATLARTKAVVGSVVSGQGRVVLNADDPHLVTLAPTFVAPVVLFSQGDASDVVAAHRARGGEAWLAKAGAIVRARGPEEEPLVSIEEVPIAFGGAAPYNVANALGAAALAAALGAGDRAITDGLRSFGSGHQHNPGRGHLAEIGGVRLLLDFGHNPEAIRGVLALAAKLRGEGRLGVVGAYAGDRDDASLARAARIVATARPARVWLRDLEHYLRGRAPGEVPEKMRAALLDAGVAAADVTIAASETAAVEQALDWARPGDLVVVLVHLERDAVRALLSARAGDAP